MTLTTLTFAFTLAVTAAQVPPAPPVEPVPPVMPVPPAMPVPPPMPMAPMMPVMPVIPDFEMPDIDFAGIEAALADMALPGVDFAMPQIEEALHAAELAMATMPLGALDAQLAAEAELVGALGAGLAMDTAALALDAAREAELTTRGYAFGWDAQSRSRDREAAAYERARASLDRRNWDDAINRFNDVVTMKGDRADAALYWKAYAESRAGRAADAQATIAALRSGYPKSRYLNDANALEVELKRGGGQQVSPASQQDEDLKLLAIQGLQHSSPEQAVPLLEQILNSSNSPRVKERALYVLALSDSPRAREILVGLAKGGGNPDLQRKAIDYLAMHGRRGDQSLLEDVYRSTNDIEVRRRVLRGYMQTDDRGRLLAVAQNESNEELRATAIRYLGNSGGRTELASLYAKEASPAVRAQIVRSLGQAGAAEQLRDVVRNEKDADVRRQAIRAFAMVGREKTGTALRDMYATESTPEGKRAIMQAMHAQDDAEGLVAIARRESDPELKEYAVRRLSTMTQSKVALDYLMELINK